MKKEELFKAMSDLDQDLIAETREEGIEVSPIYVKEGKKSFNYKPVIAAACCAVLVGTAVAAGSALGRNINVPSWYTNETVNDPVNNDEGTIIRSSSYPENAKYQYKGDYSEFKDFGGVACIEFIKHYDTYRDLLSDCDLVVVGEFVDDPWQDIDPDDYTEIQPLEFHSYNRFKIDSILSAEGLTTAEQGTEIIIRQAYAVKGGSILSNSKLTPMLKGDRWVYFLEYSEKTNTYYPLNDYMGRYPDPCYYQVLNRDPDTKDSANRILPAMTNKYGLTDENDFNENIYRTLADILYHEYMPPVQLLYDSENLEMYNITSFELAECPQIEFDVTDGSLYIHQPWQTIDPNGFAITYTDSLHKIYTADVTGDGNNDVCIQVRSSKKEFGEYIMIWDCFNNKVYHVTGETGKSEYYLGDTDGKLIAYRSELTSDESRGNVISHEILSADMTDSFLAFDFSGHNERCIYDFDYCARQEGNCSLKSGGHSTYCTVNSDYCSQQEGECPYTGGHHNEETSSGHHGHSEYCLQDADYCAQQSGECPYTGNHHNEDNSNEHHGHSEYCLQDADYCAQQEGECPYTGNHHNEDNSNEHHGHSEYCLQDADYCAQQEGECPYRPADLEDMPTVLHGHCENCCLKDDEYCSLQEGECPYRHVDHHDADDPTVLHGHCEYCLQDADYCAEQEGECPYRQSGHHDEDHSSGHGGHH